METTSVSLLRRLRTPWDAAAWERFVKLYAPLVQRFVYRLGLREHDAQDLVQEVFTHLLQMLPKFSYDGQKCFRGWLWTLTVNKCRELRRHKVLPAQAVVDETVLIDPHQLGPDAIDEAEYHRYLVGRAVKLMQTDFQPAIWQACWRTVVDGQSPAHVAAELGMGIDSVYAARSRVLRRLRQELQGLWD